MIQKKTLQTAQKVSPQLEAHIMYSDTRVELVHLALKPGELIPAHSNNFDVIFWGQHGKAVISVGNEKQSISEAESVYIPAGIERELQNSFAEPFEVLVIKVPVSK